ncbi:MAG TPA: VOC family protein [Thermoplasmata archaeon]|nr:VOC family protein [Thermoplasmata archaeon]
MEGKITQVTLVVTDQAKALNFYTEKVGFEKKTDVAVPAGYRWVTVGPKGQDLELALWAVGTAADPEQAQWTKHWAPAKAPPIVLRVADCRKTHAELSARGVEFPQPPKEYPWGVSATFKDPDGNLFSLSQPPAAWSKG